jgi:hypothetical protein
MVEPENGHTTRSATHSRGSHLVPVNDLIVLNVQDYQVQRISDSASHKTILEVVFF